MTIGIDSGYERTGKGILTGYTRYVPVRGRGQSATSTITINKDGKIYIPTKVMDIFFIRNNPYYETFINKNTRKIAVKFMPNQSQFARRVNIRDKSCQIELAECLRELLYKRDIAYRVDPKEKDGFLIIDPFQFQEDE